MSVNWIGQQTWEEPYADAACDDSLSKPRILTVRRSALMQSS